MVGRPLKVSDVYLPVAREIVQAHPTEPVVELARRFSERTGIGRRRGRFLSWLSRG
jgi:hypothetical protein